jgi:hypothetical protein
VTAVLLVLGCTAGLLLIGHPLPHALLGATGTALIGGEIAHRVLVDAGPLPVIVVASAVAALAAVLFSLGYSLSDASMGAGIAGLLAGEVAGRMFDAAHRPWWEV